MKNPLPHQRCPLCGAANQCAPASAGHFDVECWCTQATVSPQALQRLPADQVDRACLCPRCAAGVEDRG
ncbi:MAG TPA: cysteine-rich CWC family protein [Pseudomonas sp.]|uniref:cysteine-rich CWC family protein n=1 Tax=Pseudomonas sp. TaxID=306 RepID=UPI002CA9AF70|nr:cysteine-rich CWC family protein [Pseudomonas sp.]HTO20667.1 cysteine-rich CWC family protein [Pseudomonas sp.]